ncbi:MAG: hypothetical protein ABSD89_05895 [Halobacteriota archaeon]|jgi:hypothetical protein
MNVAILLGTGDYGIDALHKSPWTSPLSKKHNVFVASRVDDSHYDAELKAILGDRLYSDLTEAVNELKQCASDIAFFNQSPCASRSYTESETDSAQEWLAMSFRYISSFDRTFFDKETLREKRNAKNLDNYFTGLVEFFKSFFTTNNIDAFVNTLEDDAFSVVAYYTAKKLGISVLGFTSGRFVRMGMMFCEDYSDVVPWTDNEVAWEEVESLYNDSSAIAGMRTVNQSEAYWSFRSLPDRAAGLRNTLARKRYARRVIDTYPCEGLILRQYSVLHGLKKYAEGVTRRLLVQRILQTPNYEDHYFLFPLHYTEDAQVTFAEPVIDQFSLIKLISRALPRDYFLYVKPHPHYLATDISVKKIGDVSKLENVKIINPETKHIDLVKNSTGVITLNSTTGFEGLILGIPVITFGHDFYCKESLCYVVRDVDELAPTLMEVIAGVRRRDEKIIQEFVKKVYANTVWLDTIDYNYPLYALTDTDGTNIAFALDKILQSRHELERPTPETGGLTL